MKKIITWIILVVTVLIILGIAALLFFGPKVQKVSTPNKQIAKVETPDPKKHASFSPGESFITNIKNSSKYLKVKITLEIKDEKCKEEFEKDVFKIRDVIIGVLRNKTESELIKDTSQQELKDSIKEALDKKLKLENLIDIYIDEFVIQ